MTDFNALRELFIRYMTVDSPHFDRRRRDYNQSIFFYRDNGTTSACFCDMDMDMVLAKFDKAVKEYQRLQKEGKSNA